MRKKLMLVLCSLLSIVCFFGSAAITTADCGKIIIIVPPRPCPPRPPLRIQPLYPVYNDYPPQYKKPRPKIHLDVKIENIIQNNNSNTAVGNIQQNKIPLPPPTQVPPQELPPTYDPDASSTDWDDSGSSDDGNVRLDDFDDSGGMRSAGLGFEEPEQQAIVAWNGKKDQAGEEILILTTNEKALKGGGAALSILPLPGAPISISRSDANIFRDAKGYLVTKWAAGLGTGGLGVFMSTKIGSHNIFVWKIEDINTFEINVKTYVEETYKGKATALITPQIMNVVKGYYKRGFRYFAFDITELKKNGATKEAIAYHFKSKAAYFPLVISQIGGVGDTLVDLIVMTPGKIYDLSYQVGTPENNFQTNNPPGIEVTLNGKGTVPFSKEELRKLDEKLVKLFGEANSVQVRNIQISGKINGFKKDFLCK